MQAIELTRVFKHSAQALFDIQKAMEHSDSYFLLVAGQKAEKNEAEEALQALPEGIKPEDKFFYAVYMNGDCIGCVDLIRSYPKKDTVFLGLLLISDNHHRQGFGSRIFALIMEEIKKMAFVAKIRLGVLENNHKAIQFWKKMKFQPTGEEKPFQNKKIQSRVVLFEKEL
ncbi:MAG: GNAT family N-acetyltransferase [Oligoflexia bacterium]|nr:GNAT family N-acetyltransferase [Oligoflexia bacterium]